MGWFDSWDSTFNTLGHINNTLGAINNYIETRNAGGTAGQAIFSAAANGTVGAARVEYASERYDRTGSLSGHIINGLTGYGNLQSNVNGAMGLLFTDPRTYCGGNFFMGGMPFGYSVFGPPCMPMSPMIPGCATPPFFPMMRGGFYC